MFEDWLSLSVNGKKRGGSAVQLFIRANDKRKGVRYVLYCTQSERLHCQRATAVFSGPIEGLSKRRYGLSLSLCAHSFLYDLQTR